jgi:predicted transposase/invertase (TIGR01784 family)
LFKSLHTIEERPQSFKDRLFDRIFDMLEISKLEREDLNMYRKSMKNINEEQLAIDCAVEETTEIVSAQWYKKGKADGIDKGILKSAKAMLADGLSTTRVARITNLPKKQILAMR